MTTTAKWPAALSALVDFGADVADIKTAILSGAHNNSITTITLTATVPTEWPTAGWVTIDGEIIKYAGKSGATLTSCTRGDQSTYGGGAAASHSDQAIVGPYLTAQQVNQIVAEVIALETFHDQNADVASSGTTDLSGKSQYLHVTGTTTITALGTVKKGLIYVLKFDGILTLTHNATSLIMRSGANATTAAGDVYAFVSEGSGNWREIFHLTPATTTGITIAAEQATTSGTSKDFTGIPAGTKRITVMLVGVSTNGTSVPILQLGDSGGVETSGYVGSVMSSLGADAASSAAGFSLTNSGAAAAVYHGQIILSLEDSSDNTWVCSFVLSRTDATPTSIFGAGSKAVSPGPLDRVRLTTVNGTDAFDAGAVSISYE